MAEALNPFLQLLRFVVRRQRTTLPRQRIATLSRLSTPRVAPTTTTSPLQSAQSPPALLSPRRPAASALLRRDFSSRGPHRQAIVNPRIDDEGKAMEVEITPRAANRLKQIMATDANSDLALRVTVESGGCHGFQYLMSLTDMSKISTDEDTVFAYESGDGKGDAKVVMDQPSLELLRGSKVDFTMELIGSQFKIVDNPFATSSCGCGTSFDIKP